jgi:hypothetical protein
MSPAELVRTIEARPGFEHIPLGQLVFQGCPQDDARGREVLEAVASLNLSPDALEAIGFTWRNTLAACDYVPLDAWYDQSLRQLIASGDSYSLRGFLNAVTQYAPESMRETIWTTLEEQAGWSVESNWALMADIAVADSRPHEWVSRVVDALARRPASQEWLDWKTYEILREHPTIFMRALVRDAANFPDDRMLLVLRVLHRTIRGGMLGAQAPDLNALRWAVRGREGINGDSLIGPVN